MIKVILPGRTLALSFSYTKENRIVAYGLDPEKRTAVPITKIVRITHCKVYEIVPTTENGKEVEALRLVGHGKADCIPPDTFNKNIGRCKSLTAALNFMKLGKADRTGIWDAYHDRGNPERTLHTVGFSYQESEPASSLGFVV